MGIDAEQMEMNSNTRKKQCNEISIERQPQRGQRRTQQGKIERK